MQAQFVIDVDPTVEEDEAGHNTHALAPAVLEYVPAGHCTHALAFVAPETPENAPAGHVTHALTLLAPVAIEYAPAGHGTHALTLLAPVAAEYAPAAQFVHALTLLAPVTPEYVPGPQSVQTDAPAAAYFPAAHATHTPFTLTYPAWHPHSDVSSFNSWSDGHGSTSQAMSALDSFLKCTR